MTMITHVSGPVSLFTYVTPTNQKIILFGDIHASLSGICKTNEHQLMIHDWIARYMQQDSSKQYDVFLEAPYRTKTGAYRKYFRRTENLDVIDLIAKEFEGCFARDKQLIKLLAKSLSVSNDQALLSMIAEHLRQQGMSWYKIWQLKRHPGFLENVKLQLECYKNYPNSRFHYADIRLSDQQGTSFLKTIDLYSDALRGLVKEPMNTDIIVAMAKKGLTNVPRFIEMMHVFITSTDVVNDMRQFGFNLSKDDPGVTRFENLTVSRVNKQILKLQTSVQEDVRSYFEHRLEIFLEGSRRTLVKQRGVRLRQNRDMTLNGSGSLNFMVIIMDMYLIARLLFQLGLGETSFRPSDTSIVYTGALHTFGYREFFAFVNSRRKVPYFLKTDEQEENRSSRCVQLPEDLRLSM